MILDSLGGGLSWIRPAPGTATPLADLANNAWGVDIHFTRQAWNSANTALATVSTGGYAITANGPEPDIEDVQGICRATFTAATASSGAKRGELNCFGVNGLRTGTYFGIRFRPMTAEPKAGVDDYYISHGIETQEGGVVETLDGLSFAFEAAGLGVDGTWVLRSHRAGATAELATGLGWDTDDWHSLYWEIVDDSVARGGADTARVYLDGALVGDLVSPTVQPADGCQATILHFVLQPAGTATNDLVMDVDRVMWGKR